MLWFKNLMNERYGKFKFIRKKLFFNIKNKDYINIIKINHYNMLNTLMEYCKNINIDVFYYDMTTIMINIDNYDIFINEVMKHSKGFIGVKNKNQKIKLCRIYGSD